MTVPLKPAIVFANRYFYPDQSATSQMLSDLAFSFAEQGYRVSVVASAKLYADAGPSLPVREDVRGVEIHRVWSTGFGRDNLIGKTIDQITYLLSTLWRLLRLTRAGDVLVAKTDPPMLLTLIAPIAWLRGAHLVNWWQDVFPEVAAAAVNKPILKPVFEVLRRLRNSALRAARMNIVIGERMADHMRAEGVTAERLRTIPNWADGRLFTASEDGATALRRAWGLEGKFVVAYSGNLGRVHDSQTLVDAIAAYEAALEPSDEAATAPIVWLFIGGGFELRRLRQQVEERGLKSARFEPYQPRERLADSLRVADVHLVSLRPEFEGLIVPSKFYGIAAAGRASIFIGDQDGEIARLLALHHCGRTVSHRDGHGLARTVSELAMNRASTLQMGAAARRAFETHFDKPFAMQAWREAIERVLSA